MDNSELMQRAIDLAEKGRGTVSPNPMVGAVVVNEGKIVGEGFHESFGGPHAEVAAIEDAGNRVSGSKLIVSLEPCCIHRKTPACTGLIKKSGIKEVVIGSLDPNPDVNGKGVKELKSAGIDVSVMSSFSSMIARQNEVFFKFITSKKPFVVSKLAITLDGSIAANRGSLTRLSSSEADNYVHNLRDELDSIMIGIDTLIVDDPLLTSRVSGRKTTNPKRIIVDTNARIPDDSLIIKTLKDAPTYLAVSSEVDDIRLTQLKEMGVEIIKVAGGKDYLALEELLERIGDLGVSSVLLEGGQKLFTSFLENDLIDKFIFIITPTLMGGSKKVGLLDIREGLSRRVDYTSAKMMGDDIVVECYPLYN